LDAVHDVPEQDDELRWPGFILGKMTGTHVTMLNS